MKHPSLRWAAAVVTAIAFGLVTSYSAIAADPATVPGETVTGDTIVLSKPIGFSHNHIYAVASPAGQSVGGRTTLLLRGQSPYLAGARSPTSTRPTDHGL